MYVECPHCQTLFRIATSQLTAAEARVRCGQCFVVFNALENLRVLSEEEEQALADAGTESDAQGAPAPIQPPAPPSSLELEQHAASSEAPAQPRGRTRPWQWAALILLLLALALQVLWFERGRLMREVPALRPFITAFCDHLGCSLPVLRDTAAIDLVDRQLYTHPNVPGALMIQATMVNNAPFPQPYPVVELTLSDEQGHPVAQRRFTPAEYLPDPAQAEGLMPPGTPVALRLEVVDPGSEALAYEFRFL